MSEAVAVGSQVLYKLSEHDARHVRERRRYTGTPGNHPAEGQVYPAWVVASWGGTTVNLRVLLDGDDTYWATSRQHGGDAGQWLYPGESDEPEVVDAEIDDDEDD